MTSGCGKPRPAPRYRALRRAALLLAGTGALLLVAAAVTLVPLIQMVWSPSFGVPPTRSDAVFVFAGESARLELALELIDEGVSDTLVVSLGEREPLISGRCGSTLPVRVLCPEPENLDTKGEARMFGALASEHGWTDVVAVTGDYHSARARMLLDRCLDGTSTFVLVDWEGVGSSVVRHEVAGLWAARFLDRGC